MEASSPQPVHLSKRGIAPSFWGWMLIGVAVDQMTKVGAGTLYGSTSGTTPLGLGTLRVEWMVNRGTGLGLWQAKAATLGLLSVLGIFALLWLASRLHRGDHWTQTAFGVFTAGAIGNSMDRLLYGGVRDFLTLGPGPNGGPYPIFNLADLMLVAGAMAVLVAVLVAMFMGRRVGSGSS